LPQDALDPIQALKTGMSVAFFAREAPERLAIQSPHGTRSFAELNRRANQLASALRRRGLGVGDPIAFVCANRPEFAEVFFAAYRSGLRVTAINWHLTGPEIAYILGNCGAHAFFCDARFAAAGAAAVEEMESPPSHRIALAGAIDGFDPLDDLLEGESGEDIEGPVLGTQMLYTSGTTGRPKGVYREKPPPRRAGQSAVSQAHRYESGVSVHLATGPLYHAAPLAFSLTLPLIQGCTVVMMDGWDAADALEQIDVHRISHTHMVPTMFHQMLSLPENVRAAHDLSSLRMVLHGAAPCPVSVKQRLIEWLGPVVYEYYAATEGWGSFVTSEEWLERPGTVGKPEEGQIKILDEEGKEQPPTAEGLIYIHSPEPFEYYGDPEKTDQSFRDDYFTLGDIGYLDVDGWLFLCDRSADLIISGGVNIYPAEVDAALLEHPAVRDAATVGVPDEKWGESVLAVVDLQPGHTPGAELERRLVDFCRERLAHYKCPRRVAFDADLPRFDTGKIYRRLLRERYREQPPA